MQKQFDDIVILLLFAMFLIMLMALLIISLIYMYNKKQLKLQEKLLETQTNYEKNLLQTQLEIQEQTSQHISREIHDNISLSLTLAKLNLNTTNLADKEMTQEKISSSVELLSRSIAELSDVSKSLNADIIIQQGLLKAVEEEMGRIRKTRLLEVTINIIGNPVYLEAQKELIIFRIIQEAFNNIIRHARATCAGLTLQYDTGQLYITIRDDGMGFNIENGSRSGQAGLKNMDNRARILGGTMEIEASPGKGTTLIFTIPFA